MINFGKSADNLLMLMDGPSMDVHMKWRKRTHNSDAAAKISLIASLMSEHPGEAFMDNYVDCMRHIEDDENLNKLIYGRKKNNENAVLEEDIENSL